MARNIVLQCLKVPQISAPIQNCLMLLGLDKWDKTLQLDACGFLHVLLLFYSPNSVVTLGVLTVVVKSRGV